MGVERRVFLGIALAGTVGWGLNESLRDSSADERRLPAKVRIAEFDQAGKFMGVVEVASVWKPDAGWKASLPVDQYMVTRRGDTELAFAGEYWNFHGEGLYRCVCCGTALFDSVTKFNSGTGWPSFAKVIAAENVVEAADNSFGVGRTEVSCRRCGGHLGHVFQDGPPPDGLRYCMNSVALKYVPRV